jgi:hypothetical protein
MPNSMSAHGLHEVTREYDREIRVAVVKATAGTMDDALKNRRAGRTNEGERRRSLYERVLTEALVEPDATWDAKVLALYDLVLTDMAGLDALVTAFEARRHSLARRTA